MRFTIGPETWSLGMMNPAEWYFVESLPVIASGQEFDDSVRETLYPSPIVGGEDSPEHFEALEDWNDFVRPDIQEGFEAAQTVVIKDITSVKNDELEDLTDEELEELPDELKEGPLWKVEVDRKHTEAWYSTLNQARILMNEAHDLSQSEERFALMMGDGEDIDPDKMMLLAQYEFFSFIQSALVENIMEV
ncbi:MAG: DUF2017 family protein [Verrucomicrobiota bacterium]